VPPVRSKCVGQAAGLTRLVRLMPQSPPSPEHLRAAGNEPRRERSRQRRILAAQLDELVLATLARAAEPLSAYQIIAALRDERKTVAPPPIYRALKRLLDQGKSSGSKRCRPIAFAEPKNASTRSANPAGGSRALLHSTLLTH